MKESKNERLLNRLLGNSIPEQAHVTEIVIDDICFKIGEKIPVKIPENEIGIRTGTIQDLVLTNENKKCYAIVEVELGEPKLKTSRFGFEFLETRAKHIAVYLNFAVQYCKHNKIDIKCLP